MFRRRKKESCENRAAVIFVRKGLFLGTTRTWSHPKLLIDLSHN